MSRQLEIGVGQRDGRTFIVVECEHELSEFEATGEPSAVLALVRDLMGTARGAHALAHAHVGLCWTCRQVLLSEAGVPPPPES